MGPPNALGDQPFKFLELGPDAQAAAAERFHHGLDFEVGDVRRAQRNGVGHWYAKDRAPMSGAKGASIQHLPIGERLDSTRRATEDGDWSNGCCPIGFVALCV